MTTEFNRMGEIDGAGDRLDAGKLWAPLYESANDAFFVVGYGATRGVSSGWTVTTLAPASAAAANRKRPATFAYKASSRRRFH